MLLRIKHKLTAYHWRSNHSDRTTKLGICSCGWKAKFLRIPWRDRLRQKMCNHQWGDYYNMHAGPLNFTESADTYLGTSRMCEVCFAIEDLETEYDSKYD